MKKLNTFLGIFFVLLCLTGGLLNEKYFSFIAIVTVLAVIIGIYFLFLFFKKNNFSPLYYVGLGFMILMLVGLFIIQIL